MAKRGLLIERNNRKKKMNWKISHQYEGMSNEEEVWKESSSLEQQFLVTNRKCHLPEKLLLTCLNASSFKGSPKSLRRKSLNRPTRGAAGGDITFHSHFPSAIQIWHRWLANDCHCQKPVEDCHYQRPIGLLRNEFYSQSGYRYCKSSRGQNIIGQLGSHCLSQDAKHTLWEMEKPPQPQPATEIHLWHGDGMTVSLPAQSLISLEPCPISTSANSLQLPLLLLLPSAAKPKRYFIFRSSLFRPVDFSYQNQGSNCHWWPACTAPCLDTGPHGALISTGGSVQYNGYTLYESTDLQLWLKCLNSTALGYFYTAQKLEPRQPNSEQSRHMLSAPFPLEKAALINYQCYSPRGAAESELTCIAMHKQSQTAPCRRGEHLTCAAALGALIL